MAEGFLCRLVGIGGFEKHVVLKKIRDDIATDQEFITMFFDEARLAANLNHPNIIHVFEVDQLDGTPYLAMEYVRGATLSLLLQKLRETKATMPFGFLAHIFAGVCAGLDHAHNAEDAGGRALKIVHRDISPQNIIVSLEGTPKIFDFGVAKARGSLSLTGADRVKGKFAYMAPEQLRAESVDAKADVYAVGVCMYEAITGKRPFVGGTEGELYAARIAGRFRMPSEMVPTIPVELEHMILSAMAPDPADRPAAIELQEQLAAFCGAGTAHATNAHTVAAWVKDMLPAETEAYASYSSSSPSVTPVPRSANLAPISGAVEAQHRLPRRWGAIVGVLGVVTVAAVAMVVLRVRDNTRAARPLVVQAPQAAVQPQASAPAVTVSHDRAIRAYIDQAQKNLDDKKLTLASELLAKAQTFDTHDAELAIRRTELAHRLMVEQIRVQARDALSAKEWARATELGNQLLAEDGGDSDAKRILADAKRGAERAAAPAAPAPKVEPAAVAVIDPKLKGKKLVVVARAMPTKPAGAGSAATGSGSAGSAFAGSGYAAAAGSAAGSAHIAAAQMPEPVAPAAVTAPAARAPVAAPLPAPAPVRAVDPGSLDAMPSFAKLSVDGSLTTTEVQSALARTVDTLRGCYRGAAQRVKQTPDVSVRISFEIDEGARATGVRVSGDTLGLGGCVKDTIGNVRTRVAPDVGTVSVTAVVRFKPTR